MKNAISQCLAILGCIRDRLFLGVIIMSAMCVVVASAARADIIIQPVDADAQVDPDIANYLVQSRVFSDFVALIDNNFAFDKALVVAIGSRNGPGYDQQSQHIKMPYSYFTDAVKAQMELVEDKDLAIERALNMVEYTLYHILGHALAGDSSIEADDRAEALATWAMVKSWPNGAEQWIEDVRAFADASQKLDGSLAQYWHSHSLYKSRQEQLECWALGSDVEKLIKYFPAKEASLSKATDCTQQWKSLDEQTLFALQSVLLPTSVLLAQ